MTIPPFIPLSVPSLSGNEWEYVQDCLDTGWLSSVGGYVMRFERDMAQYTGSPHAVATINGTAALHTCLLVCGVGRGDEVLVPALTFIAPINTVAYTGAKPVFMDCDDFLNTDPEKVLEFCEKECSFDGDSLINKKTGRRVKALILVHVFGHPARMDIFVELSRKYRLRIIEDATESLGSSYTEGAFRGRQTGTVGDFGCYSFNGNKIITTGGGGMIVAKDEQDARRAKYLTTQAKDDERLFIHHEVGYNYRLPNVLAALGCAQLEKLDEYVRVKRRNFELYQEELQDLPGVTLLKEPPYARSNYWFYTLVLDPDEHELTPIDLMNLLLEERIDTRPLWELNCRQKPFLDYQAYHIEKAPFYHARCLNIPCSVSLDILSLKRVAQSIRKHLS